MLLLFVLYYYFRIEGDKVKYLHYRYNGLSIQEQKQGSLTQGGED